MLLFVNLIGEKIHRLTDVVVAGLQKRHRTWSLLAKATPSLPQDSDTDVNDLLLKLQNEISFHELAVTLNSLLDKRYNLNNMFRNYCNYVLCFCTFISILFPLQWFNFCC